MTHGSLHEEQQHADDSPSSKCRHHAAERACEQEHKQHGDEQIDIDVVVNDPADTELEQQKQHARSGYESR